MVGVVLPLLLLLLPLLVLDSWTAVVSLALFRLSMLKEGVSSSLFLSFNTLVGCCWCAGGDGNSVALLMKLLDFFSRLRCCALSRIDEGFCRNALVGLVAHAGDWPLRGLALKVTLPAR